jgi:2-oxoisovalerate dehydrogenase E1 component
MTPEEMLYEATGAGDDPNSGGRQMPSHWGHKALNIVSEVVAHGHAVPAGGRARRGGLVLHARPRRGAGRTQRAAVQGDEVVYVSSGDGTTSEGEFWESLNTASQPEAAGVFVVEDNGYAISVPVEVNTAGGSISKLVRSFPEPADPGVDGCDLIASYQALQRAIRLRGAQGAGAVHAHVIRPYSPLAVGRRGALPPRPSARTRPSATRSPPSARGW